MTSLGGVIEDTSPWRNFVPEVTTQVSSGAKVDVTSEELLELKLQSRHAK
jgi:hypothetical protein